MNHDVTGSLSTLTAPLPFPVVFYYYFLKPLEFFLFSRKFDATVWKNKYVLSRVDLKP